MELILSEKDILAESLQSEKHIMTQCAALLGEASCQELRSELTRMITETQQLQFEIRNSMKNRGLLDTEEASKNRLSQADERMTQVKNQL